MHLFLGKGVLKLVCIWIISIRATSYIKKSHATFFLEASVFLIDIVLHVKPRSWLPCCICKAEELEMAVF